MTETAAELARKACGCTFHTFDMQQQGMCLCPRIEPVIRAAQDEARREGYEKGLEDGRHQANSELRSPTAINARKTHCKRGHEFDDRYGKHRRCTKCLSAWRDAKRRKPADTEEGV